jgi:DNA-binding NarL/FixJ family response regulator
VTGSDALSEGPSSPSDTAPRSLQAPSSALPGRRPDLQSGRILELLGAGLKDEAIARQLGVSLRTVQRAVRTISMALGVTSRFQLGAEACRRGWI